MRRRTHMIAKWLGDARNVSKWDSQCLECTVAVAVSTAVVTRTEAELPDAGVADQKTTEITGSEPAVGPLTLWTVAVMIHALVSSWARSWAMHRRIGAARAIPGDIAHWSDVAENDSEQPYILGGVGNQKAYT